MKKIVTLALALFFSAGLFAQNRQMGPVPVDKALSKPTAVKQLTLDKNSSKAVDSRWYCYALTMDDVMQGASTFKNNNLFPDTTILVNYSTYYAGPWIHSIGNMFDPVSDWFNDPGFYPTDLKVNKYMPYSLDSVGMNFWYLRHLASSSVVDTLRFQILIDATTGTNMPRSGFLGSDLPWYGADTVFFKRINFTPSLNKVTGTGVYTYDVILNEAFANDTLDNGTNFAQFATPQFSDVPPGYKVGVFVTFIPGYSWIANYDTLWNKNSVRFFSYEEKGNDTYPNYVKGEYNCSYIGDDDVHFTPTDSWYGREIPTWAWTIGYGYENHHIYYHITADDNGFETVENGILTLGQNYPNPAAKSTSIVFDLSRNANVSLGVFDITGKQVMNLNQGMVNAGQHQLDLDLSGFSNGVYFFTLQAGDNKLSRKMIVQH